MANSKKNERSEDTQPTENEMQDAIIKLSESLGKNDLVSEIFIEELIKYIQRSSKKVY